MVSGQNGTEQTKIFLKYVLKNIFKLKNHHKIFIKFSSRLALFEKVVQHCGDLWQSPKERVI